MKKLGDGAGPAASRKLCLETRNVLVVCPTHRDHRELALLSPPGINFLFHDYASTALEDLICETPLSGSLETDPLAEIEHILAKYDGMALSAVISTDDYPGSAIAAIVAERLGLPGPSPEIVLTSQHKYLSRLAQAPLVPEAVPPFVLIDVAEGAGLPDRLSFPVFVKPVKSFFSIGAQMVGSPAELAALKPRWANLGEFFLPLERMLDRHTGAGIGTQRLIAEAPLKGAQVTVEGYAHGGEVGILGIVDSVMFPGTLAFSRFEYPSALPESVQARMALTAARLMQGLGFDNGLFNIEMMYDGDSDRIAIIEINPRMASQFADLYEKVDGTNGYMTLLAVAEGRAPALTRRQGRYAFAASCVLRTFDDRLVASWPTEAELGLLADRYPGIRVELLARVGRKLSDEFQDGHSYRYGIVNLGGRDRAEVLANFEACRDALGIALLPLPEVGLPLTADTGLVAPHGVADPVGESGHARIDAGG